MYTHVRAVFALDPTHFELDKYLYASTSHMHVAGYMLRAAYTPATRCVFRVFAQRVERWSDGVGDQGADEACVTNGVYPSMAAGCGVVF